MRERTEFERELAALLNKHSAENDSNTPDFILADYLQGCLNNYNRIVKQREAWFGLGLDSTIGV